MYGPPFSLLFKLHESLPPLLGLHIQEQAQRANINLP